LSALAFSSRAAASAWPRGLRLGELSARARSALSAWAQVALRSVAFSASPRGPRPAPGRARAASAAAAACFARPAGPRSPSAAGFAAASCERRLVRGGSRWRAWPRASFGATGFGGSARRRGQALRRSACSGHLHRRASRRRLDGHRGRRPSSGRRRAARGVSRCGVGGGGRTLSGVVASCAPRRAAPPSVAERGGRLGHHDDAAAQWGVGLRRAWVGRPWRPERAGRAQTPRGPSTQAPTTPVTTRRPGPGVFAACSIRSRVMDDP
jgi:hypothetical protein